MPSDIGARWWYRRGGRRCGDASPRRYRMPYDAGASDRTAPDHWWMLMAWAAPESATDHAEWSFSAADSLCADTLATCLVTFTVLPKLNFRRPRASRPGS